MKRLLRILFKITIGFLIFIVILGFLCLKPLDTTHYQQTHFYQQEMKMLSQLKPISNNPQTLKIGWSSLNLLPTFTTPIAIDAHRGGKHFTGVQDSIYVKVFVFMQGTKKVAYLTADLLIIPPTVTAFFDTILKKQGYDASNIFFTATHSHTSLGAWYNSWVGEKFAGKYDARVPKFLAATFAKAIIQAEQDCSPASIGYAQFATSKLVFNRLVENKGEVDSMLRIIKIQKQSGAKAAIITFAAHNTVFHENLMQLSSDWSGKMINSINQSGKINFSGFSAGAVGSHGPYPYTTNQDSQAVYMANGIAEIVLRNFDSIATNTTINGSLQMLHTPLYLRNPNLRITKNIVLRPWLFYKLFGNEKTFLNTLFIGDICLVGMPCDFSGELVNELEVSAKQQKVKMIVTSFNGAYIGYITASKWYNLDTYETKTMAWFGNNNAEYFSEVVNRILTLSKKQRKKT